MAPHDQFSKQASAYAQFRPTYPNAMVDYVVSLAKGNERALDLATGNGQLAVKLAPFFTRVDATDISTAQLERAPKLPNIHYATGTAEDTGFADASFDLVTVGQAAHWFDFNRFYPEMRRILKPGGILALLGYGLLETNPESDVLLRHFYRDIVGAYWDAERRYLDEMYRTLPFDFPEVEAPVFTLELEWEYATLIGYLSSWSAVQHYKDRRATDPVERIAKPLEIAWARNDRKVRFPMLLRVGQNR